MNKIRHKWENFEYYSECKICGLRQRQKMLKELQPNGEFKTVYRTEYFIHTGEKLINPGCVSSKKPIQTKLNF